MPRFLKSRKNTIDKPSGSLVHISESGVKETKISLIHYSSDFIEDELESSVSRINDNNEVISWLDIRGLADQKSLKEVGEALEVPNLWIDDILNTDHRPKLEEMEDCLFVVTKYPTFVKGQDCIRFEQVSIILKRNNLVTFQEQESDTLISIKERIRRKKGRVRDQDAIFLFYALIDTIVDRYYLVLEEIGEMIEKCEHDIVEKVSSEQIKKLMRLRQELLYLRKSALPLKDSVHQIYNLPIVSDDKEMKPFFRDTLDHAAQVVEVIESYREMTSGLIQLVQSLQGQKMNEIMTFLTIFSSIFIPLTFIAGIYGMNFEYMPELKLRSGYFVAWGIMFALAIGMLFIFKRKKWL